MGQMKTRKQMASEYGVSVKTFRKYLRKNNIKLPAGNISPKYQEIIYKKLGNPHENPSPDPETAET